jgi:hypothetical protein
MFFAEVPDRLKRYVFADEGNQRDRSQQFSGSIEISLAAESL